MHCLHFYRSQRFLSALTSLAVCSIEPQITALTLLFNNSVYRLCNDDGLGLLLKADATIAMIGDGLQIGLQIQIVTLIKARCIMAASRSSIQTSLVEYDIQIGRKRREFKLPSECCKEAKH